MIAFGNAFKKFFWYNRLMRRITTWPATIALYFFYMDWFLRNDTHLKLVLELQIAFLAIATPLWIWWLYINRDLPSLFSKPKWYWERDDRPRQTKKQLTERDKLVQEGNTQEIFSVVPGGKQ